jgi:hypothetical protein
LGAGGAGGREAYWESKSSTCESKSSERSKIKSLVCAKSLRSKSSGGAVFENSSPDVMP